jgi:hypothetical protein
MAGKSKLLNLVVCISVSCMLLGISDLSKADDYDGLDNNIAKARLAIFTSGPTFAFTAGFAIGGFVHSVNNVDDSRWFSSAGVAFELILSVAPNILLGALWITDPFMRKLAITHLACGSVMLTHSVLSMIFYEEPGKITTIQEDGFSALNFGVSPTQGGALGSLSFRF